MRKRIHRNLCAIAAATFLVTAALLIAVFYRLFNEQMQQEIRQETYFLAEALNQTSFQEELLPTLAASEGLRLTLVSPDGTVLFDSDAVASEMENHADRPEIGRAFSEGFAQEQRFSDTLNSNTYYCAVRLDDGSVIRLARSIDNVFSALTGAAPLLLLIAVGVFLLALLLAERMTRRIVAPLNELDLERPDLDSSYEELSPLLRRIQHQNFQIERQIETLRARQEEFGAITENMSEGLVLLDSSGDVLTVNASAMRLFGIPVQDYAGHSFLTLNRSDAMREAVGTALEKKPHRAMLERSGQVLELFASPVFQQDAARGVLLLVLDVTDRQHAEAQRREFSANVSHELKTPLTSISGYAELLKDGMVQPQDVQKFAGRIHREAARLIALVQDIIRVSRLDEHSVDLSKEPIELRALALEVEERLSPKAEQLDVALSVSGDPVTVAVVPQMMDELLYNLCDNAITYNRPGGTVDISLTAHKETVVIEVSDTGIGIGAEHQARVFERFYRVDKSHSRQTGGTGLGLSIVKHIVDYHRGSLSLSSTPGDGTVIKIELPRQR